MPWGESLAGLLERGGEGPHMEGRAGAGGWRWAAGAPGGGSSMQPQSRPPQLRQLEGQRPPSLHPEPWREAAWQILGCMDWRSLSPSPPSTNPKPCCFPIEATPPPAKAPLLPSPPSPLVSPRLARPSPLSPEVRRRGGREIAQWLSCQPHCGEGLLPRARGRVGRPARNPHRLPLALLAPPARVRAVPSPACQAAEAAAFLGSGDPDLPGRLPEADPGSPNAVPAPGRQRGRSGQGGLRGRDTSLLDRINCCSRERSGLTGRRGHCSGVLGSPEGILGPAAGAVGCRQSEPVHAA